MKYLLHIASLFSAMAFISCQSSSKVNNEPDFLPPLMGWSSWNTYHVDINEELIKRQADAMVDLGLKELGYTNINVDDGFFGYRDETGKMHSHPERFPNGMRVVSDYIHSLGLKAGIYSDAGDNTCGSIYDDDANGVGSGLYGHEQQDMDLYLKEWNFDFIKIDYCGALRLGLEEEKRYRTIVDAIHNTGRDDVSINICRWAFPGTWAADIARSWRISPDIRPRWSSVKNIIEKNMYLSAYAGKGHYNDMDMLEIGRGLSKEEEETHFGMWCIMSSPLLIGCDMTSIPEASLELLKNEELIALNQDKLGLQAYVVQHIREEYVFVKDIESQRGLVRAVALYNPSDEIIEFEVPLASLELAGEVKVRDLINRVDLESCKDMLKMSVKPHASAILRLEAEKRIEASVYEAEWAYYPCYNDLGVSSVPIFYIQAHKASGQIIVKNIGGRAENYAEWSNVYSEKGGKYLLDIYYSCDKTRRLEIYINGTKHTIDNLCSNSADEIAKTSIEVELNKEYNTIRVCNDFGWAPDMDCIRLTRL